LDPRLPKLENVEYIIDENNEINVEPNTFGLINKEGNFIYSNIFENMTTGSKRVILAKISKEIDKEFLKGLEI
jgi:hypothetical protein